MLEIFSMVEEKAAKRKLDAKMQRCKVDYGISKVGRDTYPTIVKNQNRNSCCRGGAPTYYLN